jgi:hypothetical protein
MTKSAIQTNDLPEHHVQMSVVLRCQDQQTLGALVVLHLTDSMRWRTALRHGGLLFGLGIATLVLPLIHYVAPPVLWMSALVVFVLRLGDRSRIVSGNGPCPHCQATGLLTPQLLKLPLDTFCDACRWQVVVEPAGKS